MRKMNIRGFNNNYCKKHNLKLWQGNGYLFWEYLPNSNYTVEDVKNDPTKWVEPPSSIYGVLTFSGLIHDIYGNYKPENAQIVLKSAIQELKEIKEGV